MQTEKFWRSAPPRMAGAAQASILPETRSPPRNQEQRMSIIEARRRTSMPRNLFFLLSALVMLAASSVGAAAQNPPAAGAAPAATGGQRPAAAAPPPMRLTSPEIADGKPIAAKYTCAAGAEAVSPELQWMTAPRHTASFTLIVHDMEPRPRKGIDDILHWMVWNMPAGANSLPGGISPASADLPDVR